MPVAEARTLLEVLEARAEDEPAGVYFELDGEPLTYGELRAKSLRTAANLARIGIGRGDTVGLLLPTCREFFSGFFGTLALGAIPVPLYPTLGPEALASLFESAEARAVVTGDWFLPGIEAARAHGPVAPRPVAIDELERPAPAPALPRPGPDDIALIQYTSGSTDQPKGVVLSHANVLANLRAFVAHADPRPGEVVVSWLPLYHDMGLVGFAFGALYGGLRLILLQPDLRNPREWLEAITRHRAAITASPDFGYRNVLRHVRDPVGLDLSSLRVAFTGAEPIRRETVEAFEARFGLRHVLCPAYGLAEATLAVAAGVPGEPLRVHPTGGWVSVGRPLPSVEVRIAKEGRPLPAGEVGEVVVRGPGVMRGYYRNPGATRRVLREGWLHTGDLGVLDEAGYLYIVGRQKDLVIVRGENVMPQEIEAVVDLLPEVRYAAAVGLPNARVGTERMVVIAEVRNERLEPEAASSLVRRIVAAIHRHRGLRPGRVLLVRKGTIPKTSSGKIQHSRLARLLAEGALREAILYPPRLAKRFR
ncbi:MAG: AMP-binding protein [Candidatus Rokubacteria bacterium]|nr:AMP-binding protein [Candidatus Rokubacteria bacterium]